MARGGCFQERGARFEVEFRLAAAVRRQRAPSLTNAKSDVIDGDPTEIYNVIMFNIQLSLRLVLAVAFSKRTCDRDAEKFRLVATACVLVSQGTKAKRARERRHSWRHANMFNIQLSLRVAISKRACDCDVPSIGIPLN